MNNIKPTTADISAQVRRALVEDLGGSFDLDNDITANLIPKHQQATATIITREDMVLCGRDWATLAFMLLDSETHIEWRAKDAQTISAGQTLCTVEGNARVLLCAERTALNFIQTLSATATLTAQCVKHIQSTHTKLLDTRKTLPGMRLAQKYAIRCGGGNNHRIGLYDAFLIKENHIAACGGIEIAVSLARQSYPDKPIEVEVENFDELHQALSAGADIVMLDNFSTAQVQEAVERVAGRCQLEVSGNITETRLAELADTGVDFISSGALTKNIQAVDLSMRLTLL